MARESVNRLGLAEQHALVSLVRAEYPSSNLNDVGFAARASAELGFRVTEGNVAGVREAFNIPNNMRKPRPTDAEALLGLIEGLERRIASIEARLKAEDNRRFSPGPAAFGGSR